MLKFLMDNREKPGYQILCLGAHSDDIEIGCGGTILRLIRDCPDLQITWIVFGANLVREAEARTSAERFLGQVKEKNIIVKNYRDGFFPYIGDEIKDYFEVLKREIEPDIIFTHYRNDLHQDHRLINELTWNTFRNHFILEYEIPKYDGDLGVPNFFVHLDRAICERKVEHILQEFTSQKDKHWLTQETFFSLLRLRGIESRAPDRYAEAFYCRKLILGTGKIIGQLK
jgi:LmbE family N-acetylglucosaminyl deacetylase